MSGLYADVTGRGSAAAAQMAIDDFGGKVLGKKIELVVADHQNKADIAASKAREWFDTGHVDAILDVAASAPALAVLEVAKQKNRIVVFSGPGTERITNDLCTPISVHYAYDTYALANSTARAVVQRGGKTWSFLTADYAFGHTLQESATAVINETGGKVLGAARHPIGASDFASYLLQAQSSKAQVVGLANAGGDAVNAIKAASESRPDQGRQPAHGGAAAVHQRHPRHRPEDRVRSAAHRRLLLGHERRHARMVAPVLREAEKMPNMSQAGTYSSVMHYLKAIQAAGTDETAAVMKQMKAMPINDFFARNGRIREDGRMIHDMYLFEVKTPAESKYPWDYYKLLATVPGDQAFMPASKSQCPLLKR
ncbi:ABC transporter substrate-binding protein [Cupriavidus basilensis]